jgi:MerR family transcriptional regulator, light-induced transcriptional regulator
MPTYPIRAVARMTGLSLDTLRAWERRYDAVSPSRGRRGREYTDDDVARLRSLGELVSSGYSIGAVAPLEATELAALLAAARGEAARNQAARGSGPATVDLQPLVTALAQYDLRSLEATLNRHAVILPPADLVSAVVIPLLREIGHLWEAGGLRPSQEHAVSAVVRSVLGGLLRTVARPDGSPSVLFATPAGERHELGLLCAAVLAAAAGCRVVYLGPDLPAEDIGHAAARSRAGIIVLSATTPDAVSRRELKALGEQLQPFEIWVGGPAARTLLDAFGARARLVADLTGIDKEIALRAGPGRHAQ